MTVSHVEVVKKVYVDESGYLHSKLTEQVIAGSYETYNELGHGVLESVYEEAMYRVLRSLASK